MKNKLIIIVFCIAFTCVAQKKKSKPKYLSYDEYTNICNNLDNENRKLLNDQTLRGRNNYCNQFILFVDQFNFFVKSSRADSIQKDYDNDYNALLSNAQILKNFENDQTEYSQNYSQKLIANFISEKTFPRKENFQIMKKFINSFPKKKFDSITKCKQIYDFERESTAKKVELNEAKITKLLYIRDNYSGTWEWITLSNGRRVYARNSNGYYYY